MEGRAAPASRSGSRTTAEGGLVDPDKRPNVFRIAPTDHGIAFRLAEYTIPKGLKIALLHDDTTYGQEGARTLDQAFSATPTRSRRN